MLWATGLWVQYFQMVLLLLLDLDGPMDVTRLVGTLCEVFRKLVQLKPKNPFVVALDRPGKKISVILFTYST